MSESEPECLYFHGKLCMKTKLPVPITSSTLNKETQDVKLNPKNTNDNEINKITIL